MLYFFFFSIVHFTGNSPWTIQWSPGCGGEVTCANLAGTAHIALHSRIAHATWLRKTIEDQSDSRATCIISRSVSGALRTRDVSMATLRPGYE